MQCPKCQRVLDDGVRFCPNDGTPLVETGATLADSTPTGGRPSRSPELQLPVVIGNRYRLEELRGGGGMAKVYRAVDVTLEREVAVKLINTDLRSESEFDARFQREARIASQLADPHIVVVHDFGLDTEHGPYLVMEYLQGQSLRERLASGGPLPLKAGLQLAGQIVLALIHAHGKGIVHRDIKPDNVFLLNQSGVRLHVRVLDFGIARIYKGDDARSETITHAGAVLGTPRYMSPEQLAGQPVDARSDIFSTALLIFEALTGQLPYLHSKKLTELCPEATPALEELLTQCLRPDPAERPQNAVEVYLRLQELGKASGILLLPPGSLDKLVATRRGNEPTVEYVPKGQAKGGMTRRVVIGAAALAGAAGLAALAWAVLFSGPKHSPGDPERLHGVRYGQTAGVAAGDLGFRGALSRPVGDPWRLPETKVLMSSPALRPADLNLTDAQRAKLVAALPDSGNAVVLIQAEAPGRGGPVLAVLTTDAAARTNRGVRVGSSEREVERAYQGEVRETEPASHAGREVTVVRFPYLGLAFEVHAGRVAAIALYPPKE